MLKFTQSRLVLILVSFFLAVQKPVPASAKSEQKIITSKRTTPMVWGDLPCQSEGNCKNPVFNVSSSDWKKIINEVEIAWKKEFRETEPDVRQAAHTCGILYYRKVVEKLGRQPSDKETEWISRFGRRVLNIQKCKRWSDFDESINSYLVNFKSSESKK